MRLLALAAAALAAAPLSAQSPGDTVRFTIVSSGRTAGYARDWREADGTIGSYLEFNDRGRGPALTTRVRVDATGFPVWMESQGVNYYKTPVTERFTLQGGRATWRNSSDQGDRAVAGRAWYVPVDASPEGGLMARALLAAPNRTLPLLPEGEARIDSVTEVEVTAGGRTQRVAQYAIHGMGFQPQYLWLDSSRAFFSTGSDWFAVVREGWEPVLPALFAAQREAEDRRAQSLARTIPRRPAGALVIRNANLFDSETGASRPGTTVVIEGNTIRAVGPDGTVAVPAGAEVVDAAGKALLPGLWDMHVHLSGTDGPLHLAAGVTSVRDLANDTVTAPRTAAAWTAGTLVGPRVVMAGFIDGSGPYTGPTGIRVDTPEQALAAVNFYADRGYEQIKVYSSLKPELVPVIERAAHARGLRLSGHIPEGMRAEDAVRAGFDELQHANFVVLNFLSDTLDTRTPQRFSGPGEGAALLDLHGPAVLGFIDLLRQRGTVVDPTLSAFEGLLVARPGEPDPVLSAVEHRFPATVRRGLRGGGLPVPAGMDQRYRDSFAAMMTLTRMMDSAGVTIVPGTDGMAGFTLQHELELYARAGIPAPRVLQIATLVSARVARRADRLGSIAPGKLADVILIDGDPARRISDIRNVHLVIKDGVLYDPAALDRASGITPR